MSGLLACVAAVGLFLRPGFASASQADIFGRPVPHADGRPTVVVFTNRSTQESVQNPLPDLLAQQTRSLPLVIVHVDLRGVPGFVHGFAYDRLRKRWGRGLDRYRQQVRASGREPAKDPENSLYFVADADGAPEKAVGLPKDFMTPLVIASDAQGRELVRVPFPQGAASLDAALTGAIGSR